MARYNVPGMGVREVHPDDEAKADSLGWQREGFVAGSTGQLPETERAMKASTKKAGSDLSKWLPTAAATGASLMIPGVGPGATIAARLAMAGRAIGAAGAGGMGGEALRRGIEREPMDPGAIVREGGRQMMFAGPGELGAQGAAVLAQPITRYAWRMSPTAQKAAGANMTATAREMFPEGEKLWVTALSERVPPSPTAIQRKIKPEAAKKGRLLAGDVAKGNTYTAFDVINQAGIPELRAQLAKRKDAAPALKELKDRINAFVAQRRLPGKQANQIGPLKRFTAEELQEEIRVWQDEAKDVYNKIARVGEAPLTKGFDTAIPRGANRAIERNIPEIGPVNARLQRLGRLEENAANVQRSGGTFLPILGGIGGGMVGDDPVERARNAAATALMMRGITSPMVQGRAGLALTSPVTQRATREIPRWLLPWMFPNESP